MNLTQEQLLEMSEVVREATNDLVVGTNNERGEEFDQNLLKLISLVASKTAMFTVHYLQNMKKD